VTTLGPEVTGPDFCGRCALLADGFAGCRGKHHAAAIAQTKLRTGNLQDSVFEDRHFRCSTAKRIRGRLRTRESGYFDRNLGKPNLMLLLQEGVLTAIKRNKRPKAANIG